MRKKTNWGPGWCTMDRDRTYESFDLYFWYGGRTFIGDSMHVRGVEQRARKCNQESKANEKVFNWNSW